MTASWLLLLPPCLSYCFLNVAFATSPVSFTLSLCARHAHNTPYRVSILAVLCLESFRIRSPLLQEESETPESSRRLERTADLGRHLL